MAALTLTPKSLDDQVVYSDGTRSNQIIFNVQKNGAPLATTALTGRLIYFGGEPAGTVSSGSTDANGDIALVMALGQPTTGTEQLLNVTLFEDAQTYGSTKIKSLVFPPVTLQNNPAIAHSETPVIVTATITNADTQSPLGSIPLTWRVLDTQLNIKDVPQITKAQNPATFQYFLPRLTDAQIATLTGEKVDLQLIIGPVAAGFTMPAPIPVSPPLLAPEAMGIPGSPPVIDDGIITACAAGIPFYIHAIANASVNDFVTLLASPTGAVADARPLLEKQLDLTSAGAPFLMLVPVKSPAFEVNGPEYIFYQVMRSKLGNTISTSNQLLVQVERQQLPTPPDGEPDSRLTDPQVSPVVYTENNYAAGNDLTVIIDFNGAYIPDIGDQVTPYIYLTGYTLANLNWVRKLTGPTYTLAKTDFDTKGVYIPISHHFAAATLARVDGSNGQAYFTVQRAGQQKLRSPSRPIIVDTMPAYSGGIASIPPGETHGRTDTYAQDQ
jgi:hypothetical protein